MTRELLQAANKIDREIEELEAQLKIAESMLHDSDTLVLRCPNIGSVILSPEARLDVLNTVLSDLGDRKEELEDRLRML